MFDLPTLFHNPRCSKSRAALAVLEARGVDHACVHYLEDPPSRDALRWIADRVAGGIRAMVRTGEPEFSALGLDSPGIEDGTLLDAIAAHPRLLERPILVAGNRAVIGRPPERILELLAPGAP
jgi:arsenate reductase